MKWPWAVHRETLQYWLIFFAGTLATVSLAWVYILVSYSDDEKNFAQHADSYQSAIQSELSSTLSVLRSLAGVYDARWPLRISASRTLVDQLVANNGHIERVEYFAILREPELSAMQTRLRDNGYPGLNLDPPAGAGSESAATVTRVAALPRDPAAMLTVGRDIARNKLLFAALERGIASGRPVASSPVVENHGLSYLLFQSVYRGELIPATQEERRLAASGAVALRIDMDRLLDNTRSVLTHEDHVYLRDDDDRRWEFSQGKWKPVDATHAVENTAWFDAHQRSWQFHDLGLPVKIELARGYVPDRGDMFILTLIGVLGLLFSYLLLNSWKHNIAHRQERARYEQELLEHRDMLEQRVRDRTRELEAFSYSVSHDLRSPLRAINGFSQMLIQICEDGQIRKQREFLDRIVSATRRMDDLIDDMLELFRISYRDVYVKQVDVTALALETLRRIREARGFTKARTTVQPGLSCRADPALLRVILHNLLENALNYSSRGDTPRVELGCKSMDGIAVLFVHDNGVGFDMKYAETVFEPFQRLHATDYTGTGIGLAIVKKAVEAQHGRVWIESEPGRGTTVYFSLFDSPMLPREYPRPGEENDQDAVAREEPRIRDTRKT